MKMRWLFSLLVGVLGVSQLCAYDVVLDGIYYTLHENGSNKTAHVVAGDEPYTGEVYLPDTIVHEEVGYPVTEFARNAFRKCSELTLIRIPKNMLHIGLMVFSDCTALKTVLYDAHDAYWGQSSPGWKFIETLILGEKAAVVPFGLFNGCEHLSVISLSDALRFMAPKAFEKTAAYRDERNWKDGVLYIDHCAIEVKEPKALTGRYEVLPDTRLIADRAFAGCTGLTEVVLPEGLTAIGGRAFYGCNELKSIYIPESVEIIRESAFAGCDALTHLQYDAVNCRTHFLTHSPAKDSIGWRMVSELTFGKKVESIPYDMFRNLRRLQSLVIPPSVKRIESGAFADCTNLASISLPANIEMVGSGAFSNTAFYNDRSNWEDGMLYLNTCLLRVDANMQGRCEVRPGTHLLSNAFESRYEVTEVVLPESVRYIGEYAFRACLNLQHINLSEGLLKLGVYCFASCKALDSLHIPQSVERIWEYAFMWSGLKKLEIPAGVKYMGKGALAFTEQLEELRVYPSTPPSVYEDTFYEMGNGDVPVYVQASAYDAYAAHEVWGKLNLQRMADVKVPDPFADAEGVFVQGNEIIIGGAEASPVSVYDVNGRRVYQGCGNRISLPQTGVYLVRTGGETVKVILRN